MQKVTQRSGLRWTQVQLGSVVVATAVLVLGACTSSGEHSVKTNNAGASNAPTSSSTTPQPPATGTCWRARPGWSAASLHDDSTQVPCSRPHTQETVYSFPVDGRPDLKTAKSYARLCFSKSLLYLGVDREHWVPWAGYIWAPSRQEVSQGARWLRCDVGFLRDLHGSRLRTVTGHIESAVTAHPLPHWACLDKAPSGRDQLLVPCTAPHLYEETGRLVYVPAPSGGYPDTKTLTRSAQQCRHPTTMLTGRMGPGTVATVQWPSKSWWNAQQAYQINDFDGICWLHRSDGTLMAPIP